MTLHYIVSRRTDGCNPFKVFEDLQNHDKDKLGKILKQLKYDEFLKTAYWFAVAHTVKANARNRCQVCNRNQGLSVHHRTYENHGYEHLNLCDLVALCEFCHGLFHDHMTSELPPKPPRPERIYVPRIVPNGGKNLEMPEGDPIVLTMELLNRCRANGAFTNETLRAFGLKRPLVKGWVVRMLGKSVSREDYKKALDGQFVYGSGPLAWVDPVLKNAIPREAIM